MTEKIQAAAKILFLKDKITKVFYIRRWMRNTDVHVVIKQMLQTKKLFENQSSTEPPQIKPRKALKTSFNLKFGDIIYLKTYLSENQKGIIAGDGIASNKLECVQILSKGEFLQQIDKTLSKGVHSKYSKLIFQKCMFKVLNSKKYYFQKLLKNKPADHNDNYVQIRQKAQEEINENETNLQRCYGTNVLYYEEIQLLHIYSQCFLTLNKGVLAKQHCCREMSLEEISSEQSNFRYQSLNQSKRSGEPILYGDSLVLINSEFPQWKLGVQNINDGVIQDGLEVNASERSVSLKLCNYLNYNTRKQQQRQGIKGKFLLSGDVITIKNRNLGGLLALKRNKVFSEFLEGRDIRFVDTETKSTKIMRQNYLEINQLRSSGCLKDMYELYIDSRPTNVNNLNALWEIQITDSFNFSLPDYDQAFLLKHVATGCYLAINKTDANSFILTYDGMQQECQFILKSKKNPTDLISYSESIKIQSLVQSSQILMGQDPYEQDQNKSQIQFTSKQQKQNQAKTVFLFTLAPQDMSKSANRICSLSIYLLQFFIFLQDWGMEIFVDELRRKTITYNYSKSFNSQKSLFDGISQLFQSLENLKSYLNDDNKALCQEIKFRQDQIRESGIINLLFCILIMIHFMIYGSVSQAQQYYEGPASNKQQKIDTPQVPEKSPQKIAKLKLDPQKISSSSKDEVQVANSKQNKNCIEEIYSIIQICIQGNLHSSNYLMQLNLVNDELKIQVDLKIINFLITQLKYHRTSVENLLKESIKYTDISNDNSYINMWVDKLEEVTEDNIQDQILFVELLSLTMIDPYENPISQSQDLCRRLIFKQGRNDSQQLLKFSVVLLKVDVETFQIPSIQFITDESQESLQERFVNKNEKFCNIYSKYYRKRIFECANKERANEILRTFNIMKLKCVHMAYINTSIMKTYLKNEELSKQLPVLSQYENYVVSVLNLYCSLCRGRNYKSIQTVKNFCGIDQNFLTRSLEGFQNTQLRYEKCLINLYTCISMDMDPLVSISNFTNRCYLKEDIQSFNIKGYSGEIFFDTSSQKSVKDTDLYQEFTHDHNFNNNNHSNNNNNNQYNKNIENNNNNNIESLTKSIKQGELLDKNDEDYKQFQEQKRFAKFLINKEQDTHKVIGKYIDMFCNTKYPEHLYLISEDINKSIDYQLYAQFQLEYMLSVLRLIRNAVDLGYNKLDSNINIFQVLPNIFYALVLKSNSKPDKQFTTQLGFKENLTRLTKNIERDKYITAHVFNRNWLLEFLIWTTSVVDDELLVLKVYLEAISLLKTFSALKMNMQLLKFIGFHKKNNNCKIGLEKRVKNVIPSKVLETEEIPEELEQLTDDQYKQFLDIFGEESGEKSGEKRMINFKTLLFNDLYSLPGRSKLNEDLINLLISNFNYLTILTTSMRQIEIIDDELELELFWIVNGNNKKYEMIKGPKEIEQDIRKTIKYFTTTLQLGQTNNDSLIQSYQKVSAYLTGLLDLFRQKLRDKPEYFQCLQNILRNSAVHNQLVKLMFDPKEFKVGEEIVGKFYKDLITFFEMFTKDNLVNQLEMIPQIENLLDLALITYNNTDQNVFVSAEYKQKTIKITSLVIQIVQNERSNPDNIQVIIEMIIKKITEIGGQLIKISQLFFLVTNQYSNPNNMSQSNYQDLLQLDTYSLDERQPQKKSAQKEIETEITLIQCLSQYTKILCSLTKTVEKPSKQIEKTKHTLLTTIMQTPILLFIIQPSNIFPELRHSEKKTQLNFSSEVCYYFQVKLHATLIILLTECCRNYRLGIQETQRAIQYEELKQILMKPSCPYIIKRAYLIFLFEVFINRVVEGSQSNEVIENIEICDILSRIIIPDLDQSTVYKYLEGLVRPSNNMDLRNQIQKKKYLYFQKNNKEFLSKDNTRLVNFDKSILKDCSEFWKYIRDKGLIYFLIVVFDEIKEDLEKSLESGLADEFSIIKDNISKMKEIFKILEQDFRIKQDQLNLEEYRDLIISIEEIIPQRKITKFGKNFRIGFGPEVQLKFEKTDTLNEDVGVEKKIQEQENVQLVSSQFKRNLKIYLMRERINIEELLNHLEKSSFEPLDILKLVNFRKFYIDIDGINKIKSEEMYKLQQERQLKNQQQTQESNSQMNRKTWEQFRLAMKQIFLKKRLYQSVDEKNIQVIISSERALEEIFKKFECYITKNIIINKEELEDTKKLQKIDEKLLDGEKKTNLRATNPTDEQIRIILRDSQIEDLIVNLQLERDILSEKELPKFLERCIDIFYGNEIYLIKICRILLENSMPSRDEMDQIGQGSDKDISKNTIKLKIFKKNQIQISDLNVHKIAIRIFSDGLQKTDDRIEALTFLIKLLEYGNLAVQQKLLTNFRDENEMSEQFFSFLRNFLLTNINEGINLMKKGLDNEKNTTFKHVKTHYEQMAIQILKLLQVLCENVNIDFQMYLSSQNEDDSYNSNTNLVREVASFVSSLLEDDILNMDEKNQIIAQGIETLIEFTTGYQENRIEICKNKRLFSLLNQKIINIFVESPDPSKNNQPNFLDHNFFIQETKEQLDNKQIFKTRQYTYQTLGSFTKLLLSMTQGNQDRDALRSLFDIVNKQALQKIMKNIYEQRISFKSKEITLDKICTQVNKHQKFQNGLCSLDPNYRSDEDDELIQTGFNIFIFLITLAEVFKEDKQQDLLLFNFQQEMNDEEYYEQEEKELIEKNLQSKQVKKEEEYVYIKKVKSEIPRFFNNFDDKIQLDKNNKVHIDQNIEKYEQVEQDDNKEDIEDIQDLYDNLQVVKVNRFQRTENFFKFYREFTGRIEIQKKDGKLQKVYFQKPFFSRYITLQMKKHLIYKSNRESDQDRIQSVLENLDYYYIQMIHNQSMTRHKILDIGAKNWRFFKDISFFLALLIVILIMLYYDLIVAEQVPGSEDTKALLIIKITEFVTIIQICLNGIICIFSAYERYPISITYKIQTSAKKIINLKTEAGFESNWFEGKYWNVVSQLESQFERDRVATSKLRQGILIVLDFNNCYNLLYFIITIFAYNNPLLYAILLLDVVKRSEDLQNIIRSITVNLRNLAKFAFLGSVGMLLFAILGFQYFIAYYGGEGVNAETFFLAVTTTISKGLRSGGGIGDVLTSPPNPLEFPDEYWGMYFYELSFFVLFNVLFIQIIFGIILDTFGQLRDERQILLKEIEDKCFVCSLSRNEIDSKSDTGWFQHIYLEHNIYHMIFYLISLKKKNLNNCNALDKYVKSCIEARNADFFPQKKALQIPDIEGSTD